MADVAILVPILNRPHRIIPLLESIEAATDVPHEVIFAASDEASIDVLDKIDARYIVDAGGDEGSWPKRINRLYKETSAPYIFCAGDDLAFRAGWFQSAMREMDQMQGGGVVAVNDLMNQAGVHLLISRDYIETVGAAMGQPLGTVMHEGFRHAYSDDFARKTAQHHNRWRFSHDSTVEHLHPGAGKAPSDATYLLGESSMAQGLALFQSLAYLFETETN